jgi:ribonuclease HI
MALLQACREAIAQGWTNVMFESDSKIVVDAILSRKIRASEFYSIISCIRSMLLSYPDFEVKFVK